MTKIIRLVAENVKRLKAVSIAPGDKAVIQITGKNSQGKSSVLDSIAYALGGKRLCPSRPIRDGASRAEISLDLGPLTVKRVFTQGGGRLEVLAKDGSKIASPQEVLDEMLGVGLNVDPVAFNRMQPRQQRAALFQSLGIGDQLLEMEREKREALDSAARHHAAATFAESQLSTLQMADLDDVPDEPVDTSELAKRIGEASAANSHAERDKLSLHDENARLTQRKWDIDKRCQEFEAWRKEALEQLAKDAETYNAKVKTIAAWTPIDVATLQDDLRRINQRNFLVDRKRERTRIRRELKTAEDETAKWRDRAKAIDEKKDAVLAKTKMPVEGLGFTDEGLTINGVPFEQASDSERLRVCIALSMAGGADLKVVIIRDGSLLDSESLSLVHRMASEKGYQVWVEQVDESGSVGVTIEDGEVISIDGEPQVTSEPTPREESRAAEVGEWQ